MAQGTVRAPSLAQSGGQPGAGAEPGSARSPPRLLAAAGLCTHPGAAPGPSSMCHTPSHEVLGLMGRERSGPDGVVCLPSGLGEGASVQFLSRSAPVECGSKGECLRPRGRDQFPRAARTQCHTPGASAIAVYPLPDLGTTDLRSRGQQGGFLPSVARESAPGLSPGLWEPLCPLPCRWHSACLHCVSTKSACLCVQSTSFKRRLSYQPRASLTPHLNVTFCKDPISSSDHTRMSWTPRRLWGTRADHELIGKSRVNKVLSLKCS